MTMGSYKKILVCLICVNIEIARASSQNDPDEDRIKEGLKVIIQKETWMSEQFQIGLVVGPIIWMVLMALCCCCTCLGMKYRKAPDSAPPNNNNRIPTNELPPPYREMDVSILVPNANSVVVTPPAYDPNTKPPPYNTTSQVSVFIIEEPVQTRL